MLLRTNLTGHIVGQGFPANHNLTRGVLECILFARSDNALPNVAGETGQEEGNISWRQLWVFLDCTLVVGPILVRDFCGHVICV